jgi:hypothetical protein
MGIFSQKKRYKSLDPVLTVPLPISGVGNYGFIELNSVSLLNNYSASSLPFTSKTQQNKIEASTGPGPATGRRQPSETG